MNAITANREMTTNRASGVAPLVSIEDLSFSFGALEILRDIDLSINPGEFVCVVGPSGCGKTTLLRLLGGLLSPSKGTVIYKGRSITEPQQDIAIVFQDYGKALLPWRDASGNVSLALETMGVPRAERAARIAALLRSVGLGNHAQKYPSELSGGMQQRLQIARCLAQEPSLLLMDEPFGAVDAMTRQTLQDEILRITGERSSTAFFVTHDLEEAIYLGDRVIALHPNPGRVGAVFEVDLPRPRHQLTTREDRRFLALRRQLFDFVGAHE